MEGSFVKFYAKIHSFTQVPTTKVNNIEKVQHSLGPFSIKSPAIKFWVYVYKAQSIKLDTSLQNWEKVSPTTHTASLFPWFGFGSSLGSCSLPGFSERSSKFLSSKFIQTSEWVSVANYWGFIAGVSEWMLGWRGSGSVVWWCGVVWVSHEIANPIILVISIHFYQFLHSETIYCLFL